MRILLGLSGGLDSTFCAKHLISQGHVVEAAVLLFSNATNPAQAEKSAAELGIKLHCIDCRRDFEDKVISYFTEEYKKARTPNPCVICNRYCKIEYLADYAKQNGFDAYATGHYCAVEKCENGRYAVKMGTDSSKDQSYVLWNLTQDQLSGLLTPLSEFTKERVRTLAAALSLSAANSPESQDICFITDGDYRTYLTTRGIVFPEGDFVNESGKVLGKHSGIINYTVGQRKGLGVSATERLFVTSIDPTSNRVVLGTRENTFTNSFEVSDLNFQSVSEEALNSTLRVKVRYNSTPVNATVTFDGTIARVQTKEKVFAPCPGQSAVFYDEKNRIAFGGFIR